MKPTDVATALFGAIEAADLEAIPALFAPEAVIWHNTDRREIDLDAMLRTMRWMTTNLSDLAYTDVRLEPMANGFVQRHIVSATNRAGERAEAACCVVVDLDDEGRIARLDEYLDSAAMSAFS